MRRKHQGFGEKAWRDADASRVGREILRNIRDLIELGRLPEAISYGEASMERYPYLAISEYMAFAYAQSGRIFDLIEFYRKRLDGTENSSDFFHAAARAANNGLIDKSILLHCQLLAIDPRHSAGLRNFAVVLRRRGDLANAAVFAKSHCELEQKSSDAWNTYGTIESSLGNHDSAMACFKRSIELQPDNAVAASNIANEYHLRAEIDNAVMYASRAVHADPNNFGIWLDYYTHLRRSCSFDVIAKIDWWSVCRKVDSGLTSGSFLMLLVLADDSGKSQRFLESAQRWAANRERQLGVVRQDKKRLNTYVKDRCLRIGFVSGDFRDHSVARFIWPLFEYQDNSAQLYCYSTITVEDQWRQRFVSCSRVFRDIGHLPPAQASLLIQQDEIDVLFDLTGFTKGSRTEIFSLRSAPIQVSWLGFPGTTGLKNMDFILVDKYLAPSRKGLITEKSLITRGTSVCFTDLEYVPICREIPEDVRGYLTFGSLNNSYKLNQATIAMWACIMSCIPGSRFLFVRREFESYLLRQNIVNAFERHGIESKRIAFLNNRREKRHYLDCYNEIDISLDTYPVTGGTTTTDSLWMGVPVVALEGDNIHQRVSSSILHHSGHPEWIAKTRDEYIRIGVGLALDKEYRKVARRNLREELRSSLLCNPKQFAMDFLEAIRCGFQF